MDAQEVRLRCIEAISHSGIREVARIIREAAEMEKWVNDAEDKPKGPRPGRPASADKG